VGQSLAEARTGACYDGLQPNGLNRNQGAESTLAYLMTDLRHMEFQHAQGDNQNVSVASA
jgi:hypothetical protein